MAGRESAACLRLHRSRSTARIGLGDTNATTPREKEIYQTNEALTPRRVLVRDKQLVVSNTKIASHRAVVLGCDHNLTLPKEIPYRLQMIEQNSPPRKRQRSR